MKIDGRTLRAGAIGNVLEWYDFAIYGFLAPVLAKLFFPSDDPTVSLIAAYGAFAVGFLMRPIGGALFGHIGDRLGRKRALILSVVLMALPSLAIGLIPTHGEIGIAATALLMVLRMVQGLAVGGEFTTSIVYLSEAAPTGRRGYMASWSMAGANGGVLLGSLVGAAVSYLLPAAQLESWGWRLPFLLGVLVAVLAYILRRNMSDEMHLQPLSFPLGTVVHAHWKAVLHAVGLNAGVAVAYCTIFYFVSGWLVSDMHDTHAEALTINAFRVATILVLVPFIGRLSDYVGRKPILIVGAAALALLAHPLTSLMTHPHLAYAVGAQLSFAIIVSFLLAPLPAALAEAFPANIRVTAVSLGYNLGWAVFGGTAPMIAAWLVGFSADRAVFAWYVTVMAAITLAASLTMTDASKGALTTD